MQSFPLPTDETGRIPPTEVLDLWIALHTGRPPEGDLLSPLPAEVGKRLWNRLLDATAHTLRACETPAWARQPPPPLPPPPTLARVAWPEALTSHSPASLHRLVSQVACCLADALEVFMRCDEQRAAALALLREDICRLAAVYHEFEQRTWYSVAVLLFEWGLRRLGHRGSRLVCALLWGEENAGPDEAPGPAGDGT